MKTPERKNWTDFCLQLQKSPGATIFYTLLNWAHSQYAVNANCQELLDLIKSYKRDLSIWKDPSRIQGFRKEFLRRLHNYLASIYSLVQHTEVFIGHLKSEEVGKCFELEKEELEEKHSCARFMRDLRTYMQHYQLPIVSATLGFRVTDPKNRKVVFQQKLLLKKNDMLKWTRWSRQSKEYLRKYSREVDMEVAIIEYQKLIERFWRRVRSKLIETHLEEFRQFFKDERKLIRWLRRNSEVPD